MRWKVGYGRVFIMSVSAVLVLLLAGIVAALAGFWREGEPYYWRNVAQSVLLTGADSVSIKPVKERLTDWGLQVYTAPRGLTDEEIESARQNYHEVKRNVDEARMALILARRAVDRRNLSEAEKNLVLAHEADPSRIDTIIGLVRVAQDEKARRHWVNVLEARVPDHELVHAFRCADELKSFADPLPAFCQRVEWISQIVRAGADRFERLNSDLAQLPAKARDKRMEILRSMSVRQTQQNAYNALSLQLAQLEAEGGIGTVLRDIVVGLLPIPKKGQRFIEFVAIQLVCSLPTIRVICRAEAILSPIVSYVDRRMRMASISKVMAAIHSEMKGSDEEDKRELVYWGSTAPHDELVRNIKALEPGCRSKLTEEISVRWSAVGLLIPEAMGEMTRG